MENNAMNEVFQDEISLTDIVQKLWSRRGLLIVLPVLFLLLAVFLLLFIKVSTSSPTVFFVQLQGIDKSAYPNGTTFSPQDLLIPEVLARAAAQLDLSVDDKFRNSLHVEYGVPTTAGIQKKYEARLSAKGLSATDIERINKEYLEELQSVSERGLRITIDHNDLGLLPEQGAILASALPRAWADIFTQKYRVLVDTSLDNAAIVNSKVNFDDTSDILTARNTLNRVKRGLVVINNDNRLKALVGKSGLNSADLQSELQRFNEIYFRTIFSGFFGNPDHTAASFLVETQLQIDEISRNIEEIDLSIKDIRSFRTEASDQQAAPGTGETVQLGDNTIRQIIDLSNKASLSDYLQKILLERRELASRRAALQTEIARSKVNNIGVLDDPKFLTQAVAEFSTLVQEYSTLLDAARQSSRQNYGDFFKPLSAPGVNEARLPPKALLILALSLILGIFCAMALALVLPVRPLNKTNDTGSDQNYPQQ